MYIIFNTIYRKCWPFLAEFPLNCCCKPTVQCYGPSCVPLYVEALTPSIMVFEDGTFGDILRFRECYKGGGFMMGFFLIGRAAREPALSVHRTQTKEMPHEHRARKQPSESQEKSPPQNLTMLAPISPMPSLQNWGNKFLLLQPSTLWYFAMATPSRTAIYVWSILLLVILLHRSVYLDISTTLP